MASKIKKTDNRIPGYVANIIVHFVFLYVVFKLPNWLHFLTEDFAAIAWLLYISYSLTIIFNIIYIIFDNNLFRSLCQVVLNVFSIIIFYVLLKIFPFNLTVDQQMAARIIIYIILFGSSIGAIVEITRFFKLLANGGEEVYGE